MVRRKVSLIIRNGIVITVDPRQRILARGSIAIDGSRIAAVDTTEKVASEFLADESIDASGFIVCPGLIDTHVHLAQALLRGCGEEVDALTWLRNRIWPLQGHFTERDGRVSAELCMLEMIRSGTTCFLEVLLHQRYGFDGIAKAVQRSGIRGVLGKAVMDRPSFSDGSILHEGMFEDKADSIQATLRHLKKWRKEGDGRVMVWFGPRPLGNCTDDTYREIAELAKENKTGVTIHHSEVKEQVSYCRKKYRMLPTEYMRKLGLVGKNIVYAHCIFLTKREIEIIRKTRTNVSHVPSSDMKLAMGVAPVTEMMSARVNVSLGCNGGGNNNTYDMLREMSRACLLQRVITRNPLAVSNVQALAMATINGAKALGLDGQIGSVEAGKKADLILVDCTKPHMQPMVDPVATLVHSASGADVDTTIVDGKVLMRKQRVLSIDTGEVLRNAKKSFLAVVRRAGMEQSLLR